MAEESRLQTKILKDLRSSDMRDYCDAFKVMKCSVSGIPDIFFTTALTGGVFIEVKGPRGVKSESQIHHVKKMNKCGCEAFFCHSWEEWMDIKSRLGMLKKGALKNAHEERYKSMLSKE